jgi:hypothetical protein
LNNTKENVSAISAITPITTTRLRSPPEKVESASVLVWGSSAQWEDVGDKAMRELL